VVCGATNAKSKNSAKSLFRAPKKKLAGKFHCPGEKLRNVMSASKRSTSMVRPKANAVNQSRPGNA